MTPTLLRGRPSLPRDRPEDMLSSMLVTILRGTLGIPLPFMDPLMDLSWIP
jgi:hypothetical protein